VRAVKLHSPGTLYWVIISLFRFFGGFFLMYCIDKQIVRNASNDLTFDLICGHFSSLDLKCFKSGYKKSL
jgi:hypothetical protein